MCQQKRPEVEPKFGILIHPYFSYSVLYYKKKPISTKLVGNSYNSDHPSPAESHSIPDTVGQAENKGPSIGGAHNVYALHCSAYVAQCSCTK